MVLDDSSSVFTPPMVTSAVFRTESESCQKLSFFTHSKCDFFELIIHIKNRDSVYNQAVQMRVSSFVIIIQDKIKVRPIIN
tara:strand:- start:141 stop:383 length:243 start_codon:yes stop_codon:yes gene_type:complete